MYFFIKILFFLLISGAGTNLMAQSAGELIKASKDNLNVSFEKSLSYAEKAIEKANKDENTYLLTVALFYKGFSMVNLGNVDSSFLVFSKANQIASNNNFQYWIAKSKIALGHIYYNQGDFDQGFRNYKQAFEISKTLNYDTLKAETIHFIGKYYHSIGQFSKSYNYYQEAVKIADSIKAQDVKAIVINDIGKHFESIGEFGKALKNYLTAESILSEHFNAIAVASNSNHLGNLYDKMGNYEKSLEYHFKALKTRNNLGYKEGVGKSLKNIGEVYIKMDSIVQALDFFQKSLVICKDVNYEKGIIKNKNNIGGIYLLQGQPKMAAQYLKSALQNAANIGYEKGMVIAYRNLGKMYLQMNRVELAFDNLQKGADLGEKRQMQYFLKDIYYYLYLTYEKKQKMSEALYFHKKFYESYKYVNDKDLQNTMAEMQIAHELEQKEKENELLRKENQINELELTNRERLLWITVFAILLLSVLIFVVASRLYSRKKINKKLSKLNAEIVNQNRIQEKLNQELKYANREKDKFFNIIAHEIRNPLWWFRNLAENLSKTHSKLDKNQLEKVLKSLDESAQNAFHLMDNLLNWSRTRLNRVVPDIGRLNLSEVIKDQVNIFSNIADARGIKIEIFVDNDVFILSDKDMLNTILRNLISNAIKYTPQKGTIRIITEIESGIVKIIVADSGIGISETNIEKLFDEKIQYTTLGISQEKGSGIGLLLCKEFVTLNNGDIYVESEKNEGTRFVIAFPLVS